MNIGANILNKEPNIVDKSKTMNMTNLLEFLEIFSSKSMFEDDSWNLDKKIKERNGVSSDSKIYFIQCSKEYKNLIKQFALLRLTHNISIATVRNNIRGINYYINFIENNYPSIALNEVNKKLILAYKEHLENEDYKYKTKETMWTGMKTFYNTLAMYGYEYQSKIVGVSNPFSQSHSNKKSIKEKYIPQEIAIQLDKIFIDTNIPLPYRTMYWVCRLIPNRITEVASMRLNCIKPYVNELALSIPMFKQNGGYISAEIRNIAIKEEGIGKFLLDLIREQIELSKQLQNDIGDDKKGFLYTYIPYMYNEKKNNYNISTTKKPTLLNNQNFNSFLKKTCRRLNIRDANDNIYSLSSHKFRHNAITDRLYEGFRIIDIMAMTHHKSSGMIISNYTHVDENILKEKANKVISEDKPTVIFRGHIINSDDSLKWDRIMRRPFAHKIGKLGVCSDISSCENDMYECLDCDSFVPNADELEYFEEEVCQWELKVRKFSNHPYMKENAQYNLEVNQKIVDKIKRALQ